MTNFDTSSYRAGWVSVFGTSNLPENFFTRNRAEPRFYEEYEIDSCLLHVLDVNMKGPPLRAGYHILPGLDPRFCVKQVMRNLKVRYDTDEFDFFYPGTLSNISIEEFQDSGFILFAQKGVDLNVFLETLTKVEFESFRSTIVFCRLGVGNDEEEAELTVVKFPKSNIFQILRDIERGLKDGCYYHPGNTGIKMVFMPEFEETTVLLPPTPPYDD